MENGVSFGADAGRIGCVFHIAAGINRIKPIRHRLEILEGRKEGVTVIDDSFNANVRGTIAAMEVLDCFEGRKIVMTPGLVELGRVEEHENYMLGVRLASHADKVILVGKRRIDWIKDGLISADFPSDSIYCVKDIDEGKKVLHDMVCKGDVIIFENDLPDRYN
jgi:UDP-N-acetylmuramoyl-tripeptide--D-alanyl-D-alanine ligase